jgi:hypothetical protein
LHLATPLNLSPSRKEDNLHLHHHHLKVTRLFLSSSPPFPQDSKIAREMNDTERILPQNGSPDSGNSSHRQGRNSIILSFNAETIVVKAVILSNSKI